jgi:hypothetical protein
MLETKGLQKGDEKMKQTTLLLFGLKLEGRSIYCNQTTLLDFGLELEE